MTADPPSKHGPDQDRTRDVQVNWDTNGHEAGGSGLSGEKQIGYKVDIKKVNEN